MRPQWVGACAADLRVHAASNCGAFFSIWRIAGRKQLTLSEGLVLEAVRLGHTLRARLDPHVGDGSTVELSIPLDGRVRTELSAYRAQAAMLHGQHPPVRAREISRAGLLHLRALQALDGRQYGASHREIAEVLFGEEAVRIRWSADGELRAQVRHLLARANAFVRGGYVALAVNRKSVSTEINAHSESLPPGFASVS